MLQYERIAVTDCCFTNSYPIEEVFDVLPNAQSHNQLKEAPRVSVARLQNNPVAEAESSAARRLRHGMPLLGGFAARQQPSPRTMSECCGLGCKMSPQTNDPAVGCGASKSSGS